MTIGEFIREERVRKGLTQEELASRTDVSIRTIQRIENGEVDPRTFTLHAIAKVLEVDYDRLINFESLKKENNSQNNTLWLALLHLSGLFILLLPPVIIWTFKKDKIEEIRSHAIDVVNFQLSMLIYIIPSSFLVMIQIGLPLVIFLGIFSTIIIVLNTIKVINHQSYRYPLSIKILKP